MTHYDTALALGVPLAHAFQKLISRICLIICIDSLQSFMVFRTSTKASEWTFRKVPRCLHPGPRQGLKSQINQHE